MEDCKKKKNVQIDIYIETRKLEMLLNNFKATFNRTSKFEKNVTLVSFGLIFIKST